MFLTTTKCLRLGSTLQMFLKTFSSICPHSESFSSWLQDSENYLTFHLLLLSRFDPFFTFYFFIFILLVGYSSLFFPITHSLLIYNVWATIFLVVVFAFFNVFVLKFQPQFILIDLYRFSLSSLLPSFPSLL